MNFTGFGGQTKNTQSNSGIKTTGFGSGVQVEPIQPIQSSQPAQPQRTLFQKLTNSPAGTGIGGELLNLVKGAGKTKMESDIATSNYLTDKKNYKIASNAAVTGMADVGWNVLDLFRKLGEKGAGVPHGSSDIAKTIESNKQQVEDYQTKLPDNAPLSQKLTQAGGRMAGETFAQLPAFATGEGLVAKLGVTNPLVKEAAGWLLGGQILYDPKTDSSRVKTAVRDLVTLGALKTVGKAFGVLTKLRTGEKVSLSEIEDAIKTPKEDLGFITKPLEKPVETSPTGTPIPFDNKNATEGIGASVAGAQNGSVTPLSNEAPLYHGTSADIKNGKLTYAMKSGSDSGGIFLTDNKDVANVFTFGQGKIHEINPSIKKDIIDLTDKKNIDLFKEQIGKTYTTYDGEKIPFTQQDFQMMFPSGKTDFASVSQYPELVQQVVNSNGKRGIAFDEYAGGKVGKTYQILNGDVPLTSPLSNEAINMQVLRDKLDNGGTINPRQYAKLSEYEKRVNQPLSTTPKGETKIGINKDPVDITQKTPLPTDGTKCVGYACDLLKKDPTLTLDRAIQARNIDEATQLVKSGRFNVAQVGDNYPHMVAVDKSGNILQDPNLKLNPNEKIFTQSEIIKNELSSKSKTSGDILLKQLNTPRENIKIPENIANSEQGANVYTELATSEKGYRMRGAEVNGQGSTTETVSKPSTFPDWVPSELRSRKLFDAVQEHLVNDTTPTSKPELRLYKIVKSELEKRTGTTPELTKVSGELTSPVTSGEMKTSKLAQGVMDKAVENKLTRTLGDLPEYQTVNMKEQAKFANEFINVDPEGSLRVATGREVPPAHILPESVFTAVEEKALQEGDVATLQKLANSNLTTEASAMGQRIRALAERNPDSPVAKIQDVQRVRIEAKGGQEKITKQTKTETGNIKSEIKKTITPKTVSDFIESLRCK